MFDILKKPDEVTDALPTPDELEKALASHVETSTGESVPLSDLVAPGRRTLLTFVRHHHCGICHEFVRSLGRDSFIGTLHAAAGGDDDDAAKGEQQCQVVVVGHGPWKGIETYKQRSECKFDMVVDHEAKGAYQHLGLTRSTLGGATSSVSHTGSVFFSIHARLRREDIPMTAVIHEWKVDLGRRGPFHLHRLGRRHQGRTGWEDQGYGRRRAARR